MKLPGRREFFLVVLHSSQIEVRLCQEPQSQGHRQAEEASDPGARTMGGPRPPTLPPTSEGRLAHRRVQENSLQTTRSCPQPRPT